MKHFAWFRRDLPWLGPGFVYCVHADEEANLRRELERLDFALYVLDGSEVINSKRLHAELARVFEFPAHYGANWDAFDDVFDDEHRLPARSALLWLDSETLAANDLKTFAESVAILRDARQALSGDERQFELFLLGTGPGFRRPSDPVSEQWRTLPL